MGAFLQRLGPSYVIVEERESPDFLISDGKVQFGIEVAQVFRNQGPAGSPSKAAESRRMQYLRRLASDYYSRHGLPLLVKAQIPDRFDANTGALADRLRAARPADPWNRRQFTVRDYPFHLTSLPPEVGQYRRWVCINNSVGWRGWLATNDIGPVIDEKASKLSNYRKAIARVELLLVVDATRTSGMVRWRDGSLVPVAHGFDAIHLYFHPIETRRLA